MRANEQAREIIRAFEGLRLSAYLCPGGVWTIGYGHTAGVIPGQRITLAEAEQFFEEDLAPVEAAVSKLVRVELSENQFGALCSFAFNAGIEAFKRSTLLVRLNRGDYAGIPAELRRWAHSRGVRLPGLVRRREAEIELFICQ